jgi:hypothetical protein
MSRSKQALSGTDRSSRDVPTEHERDTRVKESLRFIDQQNGRVTCDNFSHYPGKSLDTVASEVP